MLRKADRLNSWLLGIKPRLDGLVDQCLHQATFIEAYGAKPLMNVLPGSLGHRDTSDGWCRRWLGALRDIFLADN